MGRPFSGGRVLALDVGDARIGVAVSDAMRIAAQPLTVLDRTKPDDDVRAILALAEEQDVAGIVVGMPLTLRGEEGPAARKMREFIEALSASSPVPIAAWDERLTTRQAARAMAEGGEDERRRRGKVDKVAAALILQSYLDASARTDADATAPLSNGPGSRDT